jgi:DNA-binding HxlR family transcriptional regulator
MGDDMLTPKDADFLPHWYRARSLIAPEWAPPILVALLDGPLHYRQIKAIVSSLGVTDGAAKAHRPLHESSLSRTLARMTRDGLLDRHEQVGAFPPSVTYSLTAAARAVLDAAVPLADWAQRNPH